MEIFETILVMLALILASNILQRFLPFIAVPIIQIVLGGLFSLILPHTYLELSPELFMLLFIAPLLFNDGVNVDKKSFFKEKKAIFILSICLVFVTVGVLGWFIHLIIPTLPWAACFALAAALAPTDAVAVSSLADKVKMPKRMLHILEGESLINDASGLVSFQFAAAALLTGVFSMTTAVTSFFLISLGGIVVGVVLGFLAILFLRWLKKLGIQNNVSFILFEILLPFAIYLVAEECGVNGILAVVAGGIVYSYHYKSIKLDKAQLNVLSKSTWSILTFNLNGLVFILLGTQLPHITAVVWNNQFIDNRLVFISVLLIAFILLFCRFLCFLVIRNFEESFSFKQSMLYTVSGVRGTITLVSALSLPLVLNSGAVFEARELLISIASGVILVTLLLANFTMPLFAEKKVELIKSNETEIIILQTVIAKLKEQLTSENKTVLKKVIKMYNDRLLSLSDRDDFAQQQEAVITNVLHWKYTNTLQLLNTKQISVLVAFNYLRRLNHRLYLITKKPQYQKRHFMANVLKNDFSQHLWLPTNRRAEIVLLRESNRRYVLLQLREAEKTEDNTMLIDFYLLRYARVKASQAANQPEQDTNFDEWLQDAIQLEREELQVRFENGDIKRLEQRNYLDKLLTLENSIQFIS